MGEYADLEIDRLIAMGDDFDWGYEDAGGSVRPRRPKAPPAAADDFEDLDDPAQGLG